MVGWGESYSQQEGDARKERRLPHLSGGGRGRGGLDRARGWVRGRDEGRFRELSSQR